MFSYKSWTRFARDGFELNDRDGFEHTEQILSLPYHSDDDLTLEDLIAVETIDESQEKAFLWL